MSILTPPFLRHMTQEKYDALSPAAQRAYTQKIQAIMDAQDAKIDQHNLESYKAFSAGLAQLIASADVRYLEWEIVGGYLQRAQMVLVEQEFYESQPGLAGAHVQYQLDQIQAQKAEKAGKSKKRK